MPENRRKLIYWLGPLCLVAISFLFYLHCLNPGVDWGDSGETMTCLKTSGICHPPGYPFYILTAKLFSFLPWGALAFKVNLFSALCACLALGVFGLAVLTVFPLPAALLALLVSGFSLAFSKTFFFYAGFAKGYALNLLLFGALIYLALKWEKENRPIWFQLFCLVLGFSLSNAYQPNLLAFTGFLYFFRQKLYPAKPVKTFLLFLLPLALLIIYSLGYQSKLLKAVLLIGIVVFWLFYLFKSFQKIGAKAALAGLSWFMLGLLPYLYIPLRAKAQPFLNWDEAFTFKGFIDLITIADYRIHFAPTLSGVWPQFPLYFKLLKEQFTYLGVLLGGLGAFYWWKNHRPAGPALLLIYLYLVLVFPFQLATPMDELTPLVMEGFYLPAHFIFALWMAGGIYWLLKAGERFLKISPRWALIGSALLLLLPACILRSSFAWCDRHRFTLPEDYAYNLLLTLPAGSVLLTQSDDGTFPLWYLQQVKGMKPEIPVLMTDLLSRPWYRRQVSQRFGFQFSDYLHHIPQTGAVIKDLIACNYHRNYYLDYPTSVYYAPDLPQTMTGLLFKIVKPGEKSDFDLKLNLDLLSRRYRLKSALDPGVPRNFLIDSLTQPYLNNLNETARRAKELGMEKTAINLLDTALKIAPENPILKLNLRNCRKKTDEYTQGLEYLNAGKITQAIALWETMLKSDSRDINLLNALGNAYLLSGDYRSARNYYLRALKASPQAPFVHFNLGRLEEEIGNHRAAEKEFRLELKNNPGFKPAQTKLEESSKIR